MTLQQASSLAPNKAVARLHSQKRLQRITKDAVDRAYKLHTESRRLVHIVDTQGCGNAERLGRSNAFSSLFSVLLKNSPSTSPSPSGNWALSKESKDRRSVTARIHALLIEWRADSSLKWRARVASVVPLLEEVLYKEAKSKEEYTNAELLESQLMHVLCQFEAGNGPFLLQDSSPLYPVRNWYPTSSPSDRMSSLSQYTSSQGVSANEDSHEIASAETYEMARLSCTESSASGSSANLTEVHCNSWEIIDSGLTISTEGSSLQHRGHASKKFVKKIASMLVKKKKEKSELGRAKEDAQKVEKISVDAEMEGAGRADTNSDGVPCDPLPTNDESQCNGNERKKRTLGGMLGLNMFGDSVMENSLVINGEEALLALSATNETTSPVLNAEEAPVFQDMIYNLVADAMEPCHILDSQAEETGTLSLSASLLRLQVVDNEASNISTTAEVVLESSETDEFLTHGTNCARRSLSHSPFASSSSASKSSSSSSLPFLSHPTPLSSPSPSLTHLAPSSSASSLSSSSSSPSHQQIAHRSITCFTPLPRDQQSPSFSRQHHELVPPSTSSSVSSTEINHTWLLENQNRVPNDSNEMNVLQQLRPMASVQATKSATEIEFEQPTTQAASDQPREAERRASSSTSSPSASDKVLSGTRGRGVKLPLRSFLEKREEYRGWVSTSYEEGGPWETWEEATEQLDGMCCVCMVGLKGAAFIPCGHTFCRKCSRELWKGRGTCPLCNRFIREILDIY